MRVTDEMVEKGAQAIRDVFGNKVGKSKKSWDQLPQKVKDDYRDDARACLEAVLHDR